MLVDYSDDAVRWFESWAESWELMADAFGQSKPSPNAVKIYAERLNDIPEAGIRAAVEQCIATCRFFPTIAELREAYDAMTTPALPDALEAWAEVGIAVQGRGHVWTNPLARRIAMNIGFQAIASSTKPGVERSQFIQAYREAAKLERGLLRTAPRARALLEAGRLSAQALPSAQLAVTERYKAFQCEKCGQTAQIPSEVDPAKVNCRRCNADPASRREWVEQMAGFRERANEREKAFAAKMPPTLDHPRSPKDAA